MQVNVIHYLYSCLQPGADGAQSVVLIAYLMACPEFSVVSGESLPEVEPFCLLDGLPAKGAPGSAGMGTGSGRGGERAAAEPAAGHRAPAGVRRGTTSVADRDRAKATELGVSLRTIQIRRARYAQQGLWGLVDAETDMSTGTPSQMK